jgi:uncharacterized membrane protein (UPF0127 family)
MVQLRSANGTVLWRLKTADSWFARLRGLMGQQSLEPGEGLYLPGTNGIHMLFMRFPIDCVFLGATRADGLRQVVALRERLSPWTGVVWWVRGAKGVAELPQGSISAAGLHRGDLVRLEPAG